MTAWTWYVLSLFRFFLLKDVLACLTKADEGDVFSQELLKVLWKIIYDMLVFNQNCYGQGDLFPAGALNAPSFSGWLFILGWRKRNPASAILKVRNYGYLLYFLTGAVLVLCISCAYWVRSFCYDFSLKTIGCLANI